jgi:hypothetical protein
MPQPIQTAPKDGNPILTDCGFVRHINQNYDGGPARWVECDPFGNIYECADNGMWTCSPKIWEPVPEWINK